MNLLSKNSLKHSKLLYVLCLILAVFSTTLTAQEQQEATAVETSEAELAQMLAPIALYPDTLLTHILIAATYPIEVIEAERWLKKNSQLTAAQLDKKAQQQRWDASIKALLAFPRVMAKLSDDLTWMQKLGDAFLQDEARVLASIQTLRQQAEQAGSLANIDNVNIIKEQQVIIIEPAQPEIIYVPYYDSRVVYGNWHWSHYPPIYWHNPYYYAAHYGHFYWGHGVHISSYFYFSAFHWHNRHVVVNHYNMHGYHPRKKIVVSHHAKRWHHQPKHRRGVAYSSGRLKQKYYRAIIHSDPKIHHNNQRMAGSSHQVRSYNNITSVNRHKNFNEKLKVKSHPQSKQHNKPSGHKVSKSKNNYYADNSHFNNKKHYNKSSHKSSHNRAGNVYKVNATRSEMVRPKATRVPSKQHNSRPRQSVKKSSVRTASQHKQRIH
ncbi:DUF3300 domain-containing protein [Colwellia piezophila]|uniref:DUF3300 domain-containing protein n=1 Tax=Colwellia piezophila TaxID=211668 RepID=UPI00036EA3CB|nr:DUF3300 domain-containing protein [Colwellia piezophila]